MRENQQGRGSIAVLRGVTEGVEQDNKNRDENSVYARERHIRRKQGKDFGGGKRDSALSNSENKKRVSNFNIRDSRIGHEGGGQLGGDKKKELRSGGI